MESNPVAVVTGASRGLGAHIARRLATDGWAVAVNYRAGKAAADAVVDAIRRAGGVADAFGADVVDEAAVTALFAEVERRLGPVRAVVANATGPQPEIGLEELTWRAHLDQLEFFVKSPTLLVQAALPGMRAHGSGRVILIGSDHGRPRHAAMSAYVAAKCPGRSDEGVGQGARPENITVNLVQPGWIPVERHEGLDTTEYAAEVPLRRMDAGGLAGMVGYLASDAAGFVTGQRITVNGGHVI